MNINPLSLALEEGCKPPQCLTYIDTNILSFSTSRSPDGRCCYSLGRQPIVDIVPNLKQLWHDRILPIKCDLSSIVSILSVRHQLRTSSKPAYRSNSGELTGLLSFDLSVFQNVLGGTHFTWSYPIQLSNKFYSQVSSNPSTFFASCSSKSYSVRLFLVKAKMNPILYSKINRTPKWICNICKQTLTRKWNAKRHCSKKKHDGLFDSIISFREYLLTTTRDSNPNGSFHSHNVE